MTATQTERVTRDDIEDKFRELQGEVGAVGEEVRGYAATVGAVVAVIVIMLAFWLGLRKGRRSRTVVEVKRFG